MFLFFSLLAASIDGFVSGLLIAGMGINFTVRDFLKSLTVIFICCISAAFLGKFLAGEVYSRYISTAGAMLMIYLAWNALKDTEISCSYGSIYAISLSVAADAAIVCIYLAACGYNILSISVAAAVMHACLMTIGEKISGRIIKHRRKKYTKYISAAIFATMAVYKLWENVQ